METCHKTKLLYKAIRQRQKVQRRFHNQITTMVNLSLLAKNRKKVAKQLGCKIKKKYFLVLFRPPAAIRGSEKSFQ